jgi:hypothetical protein
LDKKLMQPIAIRSFLPVLTLAVQAGDGMSAAIVDSHSADRQRAIGA